MDYEKQYLKYKNKYFKLKQELTEQGHNVDEILQNYINNKQTGGGNYDLNQQELTEMNLSETPTIFNQDGGYIPAKVGSPQPDGTLGPPIPERFEEGDVGVGVPGLPYAKSPVVSSPPPVPPRVSSPSPANSQKTTTNVRNVYNYFDPLYPTYTVPAYNPVVTRSIYTVPTNTFPILKRNDDFFLDNEPPRRTSRRTSRRKSSRRKSSKRKSSKRRSRR